LCILPVVRPWIGPPLTALRYVVYFRLVSWIKTSHMFSYYGASGPSTTSCLEEVRQVAVPYAVGRRDNYSVWSSLSECGTGDEVCPLQLTFYPDDAMPARCMSVCLPVCLLRNVRIAESEPYCHSILFVCLSVRSFRDLQPSTIDRSQPNLVGTCPRTGVSLFGSPVSHTLGARGKICKISPISNAYSCHCERDASCHI